MKIWVLNDPSSNNKEVGLVHFHPKNRSMTTVTDHLEEKQAYHITMKLQTSARKIIYTRHHGVEISECLNIYAPGKQEQDSI